MSKNLIICVTPFQMLLADKLINKFNNKCDFLLLTYIENNKYAYYFDKVSSNVLVEQSMLFILEKSKIKNYINLRKVFRNRSYEKVIFASINDFYIQSILGFIRSFNEINTFDDGTANIFKDSLYYERNRESFLRILFAKLFNKWDIERVKEYSMVHYTVYPNISNIIENTQVISFFSDLDNINTEKSLLMDDEYIFLGQPFDDISLSYRIFSELKLTVPCLRYYIHPRENINNLEQLGLDCNDLISSELLLEDYIFNLIKDKRYIYIYSISSSAAFNLAFINRVSICFIRTKYTSSLFESSYEMSSRLGLNILDIDE